MIENGWLIPTPTIKHTPSPNYDARPVGEDDRVSLLVIHHISLPPHQFGGDDIEAFFCNRLVTDKAPFYTQLLGVKVSAHLLIRRNGAMVQFVSFDDRAWHAGASDYQGRVACNDFSIGIELEGDDRTPYRYAQYKVLAAVTRALIMAYPAIGAHIVGHEDIAPARKTDPGPTFDWQYYRSRL